MSEPAFLPLPDAQRAALEAAYATPPRAYHNARHVEEVLRHFDAAAQEAGWERPADVRLAVLYHDAIYEPGRKDNEARSADLVREHLQRWPQPGVDAERVAELILLTARHGQLDPGSLDRDAAQFLDCDMAILGSEPATFAAYDRAIAAEYRGQVPAWLYKLNRRRFLKGLLGRERIYLSQWGHARFDAQARINLRRAVTHKQ
jgi:predicted metal-dependent HD superfamily phosphohydrolase